ncbi:LamG-like jellyroll fold domain-containing protein [Winogradskyella sp. SYSU M77433]|uniref:LamG-like jellyroll fold domain-containing protein n=1 Tax=Winogradskyella sp. SYSU M77433 TaxID=3042722 RepID=UPI00247FF07D|nr:LamG-like jellyroll fold domain-containing protein [Winogradskyella sp. SYSU M77433]MDH7911603.1 Ig-like domain-containing protein [Winogradskyella sp. SYSU M77433]
MKTINKFIYLFSLILVTSCYDGIDPITEVDPGPDAGAPIVDILYPSEGDEINTIELVVPIDISFRVEDDIEVASITVSYDGDQIASYNGSNDTFLDYRIVERELTYDNVTTGEHTVSVTATDIAGNSTTSSVTFEKAPPYEPIFPGEVFYMSFNGIFTELVSLDDPVQVGTPEFAGEAFDGSNSFRASEDSYLTFPIDDLMFGSNMSGAFWYKVNAEPNRSGILTVGDDADDRNQGFRLFREGSATEQRIKLNVGTGTAESWNDGGVIDVAAGEWVHVAFTISPTETVIYLDGVPVNTGSPTAPIDWTGCTDITIGAGGETFSYWNHLSDNSSMDELRLFNTTLTQAEVQTMINASDPYEPLYNGETFYMPFDGSYTNLMTYASATEVGTPSFAGVSYEGSDAYMGATDSYLTYPIEGVFGDDAFSVTFWYNVNSTPDRSGIITVGDDADDRNQGFRLFREGSATEQRIKANVGIGSGESWNDGGLLDATTGDWVHVALTVSATESKIYFNGVEQLSSTLSSSVDWTGCTEITIGAGGETFSYWNHLSDLSALDELRFYNIALSETEIQDML